ncbi:hypothetical protein HMPREF9946_05277 [Acetobacteraceae bacterium AT-5844]|nr:hypothetical protein HMPREF9946_05277 [Acetobacteraceae bacterium AT-5844]
MAGEGRWARLRRHRAVPVLLIPASDTAGRATLNRGDDRS